MMVVGALVAGVGYTALRTGPGRKWVERQVASALANAMGGRGSIVVHGLDLVPIGSFAADSIVLRDSAGARVIATGAIRARVAVAALLDRVLVLEDAHLVHPRINLVQQADGTWNIAGLVPPDSLDPNASRSQAWKIRIRSLTITNGELTLAQPDTLPALPPIRTAYTELDLTLGESEYFLEDGSGTFVVEQIAVAVSSPPVRLRDGAGRVELFADSAHLDFPRLTMGRSDLGVRGTIGFASGAADTELALTLRARSVDLADITWISDLIPKTGSGSAVVRIQNGKQRGWTRYALTDLIVRATGSELRGRLITEVGTGARQIEVRDVDVTAAPLDLRLVREIFGDSSPPPPWDGTVRGQLRARGGPLDNFTIDPSTIVFEDRRVGTARSRFTLAGTMDLLATQTIFKPLDVRIDSMDVRTVGGVTEVADSLHGYLTGRVHLTGPLDNIGFSDLELVHNDGDLPRSRLRGEGRIADDASKVWLEARLDLDTIGVAALGRAFTTARLAGTMHGTAQVSAIGDSVSVALALSGDAGQMTFNGATSMDTLLLVAKGEFAVVEFDARKLLPDNDLPPHLITASALLGLDGPWESPAGPIDIMLDSGSTLGGIVIAEARAYMELEPGGIRIDTLSARARAGRISAQGQLSRDPTLRDTLRFVVDLDSVAELRGFLPDSLALAWTDSLRGHARLAGIIFGSLDTLDLRATLTADSLQFGSYGVRRVDGEFLLDGIPSATHGLVTFDALDIAGAGLPVHRVSAEATVREAAWADASVRVVAADTLFVSARADLHFMGDSLRLRVDSLDAHSADARWTLQRPAEIFNGPDRLTIDSLELLSAEGARFAVNGRVDTDGTMTMEAHALRVPLSHARFTGWMPPRINGELTFDARLDGTQVAPLLALDVRLDSTRVDGRIAPELAFQVTYAERLAAVTMTARMLSRDAFTLVAELPMDLTFEGRTVEQRLVKAPLYVRLIADGSALNGLEALLPGIRDLRGRFDADVQVTGNWDSLEPRGNVLLRGGAFTVPALGAGFQDLEMDLGLAPDSIILFRARLTDDRSSADTASVDGSIVRTPSGWAADLRTVARSLRVIDDPRVAEANVTWNLRLRGPLDSLRLGGDVLVPNANVFIGQQERRILVLDEDLAEDSTATSYAPTLEGLRVRLGNEVRLRSPEANVQLTGEVAVVGTLDAPDVRGEIFAARGTYRLDLGLLQRTFQVDSGLVRMNGPLSIAPNLDIFTSYTVRQAQREDVHINARINGTTDAPRLLLSSSDLGTTASETEIISYLLFGAPTFVLDGQRGSAVRLATAALIPSLGGAAERALGAKLPFLSELQVVTIAGDSPSDFTLNSFEGLLNSFALTAGTQVGSDSYLRLSGGVCRGANRAAESLPAWFGIAAEYRPRERLSAEVSLTPGSAPCNRIGSFAQIYQFGMDLYKDWRW